MSAERMTCTECGTFGHDAHECYTCERKLCVRDFGERGGHRLKSCRRCRWLPECRECGLSGSELLLNLNRGTVGTPLNQEAHADWTCTSCEREREEAARQARLEVQRARRRANPPEPGRAWAASARRRLVEYGWDPVVHEFTKAEATERQGAECCAICAATEDLALDHIHPLAAGGTHTLENVRLLCAPCNGWKVAEIDRPLIEAARAKVRRAELSTAA